MAARTKARAASPRLPATLADFRRLIARLPGPDRAARARAERREPTLTKPPGALGRLEALAAWAAAWQGRHPPRAARIAVRVFAGNHGVVAQGVSAYPPEVTAQMIANFRAGGAAINQMCASLGAELKVIALDLARPTADFTAQAAMSEIECMKAIRAGMKAVPARADLLCVGEMGIGNTAVAAALCHGLFGDKASDWTGPGTGVKGRALAHKARVVARAVAHHRESHGDAIETLRRLGGRELAAIAGAVVMARLKRIPVVLDGFVATAAAAPLHALRAGALAHCVAGHVSAEPGHRRLLHQLDMAPLLDLGMRLGEATGAVLAAALVRAACACHAGMATFESAGVSDKG